MNNAANHSKLPSLTKKFLTSENHYIDNIFADKIGQINVEIKNPDLPTSKFDDKTKVSISGKLDKKFQ